MKNLFFSIYLFCLFSLSIFNAQYNLNIISYDYDWTVIGAGPAGIIAISLLLDMGIDESRILWIDPTFSVGRMGDFYQSVIGNTDNQSWIDFLLASPTISYVIEDYIEYIKQLNPKDFEPLSLIVKPLEKVTQYLKKRVNCLEGFTQSLDFYNDSWYISVADMVKSSKHVILATGSKPKTLNYDHNAEVIPLDYALNKDILKEVIREHDTVAVFGSAHSAILILKYLCDMPHKKIYNFYNNDLVYAVDEYGNMSGNFGLKGKTAEWARQILEKNCPDSLHRVKNTQENREAYLLSCNKVIFAVGYQQNNFINIKENGSELDTMKFDPQSGILGIRLYGIGIAFPGCVELNSKEKQGQIGLFSFMKYALLTMPEWISAKHIYDINPVRLLQELAVLQNYLTIEAL